MKKKTHSCLGNRVAVEDSVYNPKRISNFLVREAQVMTASEANTFQSFFINITKVKLTPLNCIATSKTSLNIRRQSKL